MPMSTDTDYLNDMLDRIVAMEKEALSSLAPGVNAVPYWPYQQSEFPYFTNRPGPWSPDYERGEDVALDGYSIAMRLVAAHVDEGYEGGPQGNIHQWILAVINFFEDKPFLTSTAYSTALDFINSDPGAEITSHTGLVIFRNAGVFAQQLGVEFTLEVPVLRQIY